MASCHHHKGFACGTGFLPVNYRIPATNSKYYRTKFIKGDLAKTNYFYFCRSRPDSFVVVIFRTVKGCDSSRFYKKYRTDTIGANLDLFRQSCTFVKIFDFLYPALSLFKDRIPRKNTFNNLVSNNFEQ